MEVLEAPTQAAIEFLWCLGTVKIGVKEWGGNLGEGTFGMDSKGEVLLYKERDKRRVRTGTFMRNHSNFLGKMFFFLYENNKIRK
jgi:hypothetical protein